MSNPKDDKNNFPSLKKVPSTESFLSEHRITPTSPEEYTPKALPTRMKHLIQLNITDVLGRIRTQLKEFTVFVEGIQRKMPTPDSTVPEATESSTKGDLQPVDPRPKNAPLRDAFQMVRNLLVRISNVIDQVAADIPAEDDHRKDVNSPRFDLYYAQYVFQLELYILQTVGEELERFSKQLGDISVDDTLCNLPSKVDEVDADLSTHKVSPVKSGIFPNFEALGRRLDTSCEEASSGSDNILLEEDLKKRAVDALELLVFLSEKIFHYFQESGMPQFSRVQQREFSKRALGIPDLCKSCSKKVVRQLRRYSSMENLHAEKYEISSDESSDTGEKGKRRHAHFNDGARKSYFKSNSKPSDIQDSPICLEQLSTQTSNTGIKMTLLKQNAPFKSSSHVEPLISKVVESTAVFNQAKGTDDSFVGVLTVTEDPEKIHFNLKEFCSLLKEQFRKLLSEESKSDATQSKIIDSNAIVNVLIHCFREASKGNSIRFDVTAQSSSRDADVEQRPLERRGRCVESPDEKVSAEEHEQQLDSAVEQFVRDTYKLAHSAVERKKSSVQVTKKK